jgi:hypothetical protein
MARVARLAEMALGELVVNLFLLRIAVVRDLGAPRSL